MAKACAARGALFCARRATISGTIFPKLRGPTSWSGRQSATPGAVKDEPWRHSPLSPRRVCATRSRRCIVERLWTVADESTGSNCVWCLFQDNATRPLKAEPALTTSLKEKDPVRRAHEGPAAGRRSGSKIVPKLPADTPAGGTLHVVAVAEVLKPGVVRYLAVERAAVAGPGISSSKHQPAPQLLLSGTERRVGGRSSPGTAHLCRRRR